MSNFKYTNNDETLDLTIYTSFCNHRGFNPIILDNGDIELQSIPESGNPTQSLFTMDTHGIMHILVRENDPITETFPNILINGIALLTQMATAHPKYFNQPTQEDLDSKN